MALPTTTYLNDVRFDLRRNVAYITDSSDQGPNAFLERLADGPAKPVLMGADGIAISADGSRLYYCPLASRHWYSVSTDALVDRGIHDDEVAATVVDEGTRVVSPTGWRPTTGGGSI